MGMKIFRCPEETRSIEKFPIQQAPGSGLSLGRHSSRETSSSEQLEKEKRKEQEKNRRGIEKVMEKPKMETIEDKRKETERSLLPHEET